LEIHQGFNANAATATHTQNTSAHQNNKPRQQYGSDVVRRG